MARLGSTLIIQKMSHRFSQIKIDLKALLSVKIGVDLWLIKSLSTGTSMKCLAYDFFRFVSGLLTRRENFMAQLTNSWYLLV